MDSFIAGTDPYTDSGAALNPMDYLPQVVRELPDNTSTWYTTNDATFDDLQAFSLKSGLKPRHLNTALYPRKFNFVTEILL